MEKNIDNFEKDFPTFYAKLKRDVNNYALKIEKETQLNIMKDEQPINSKEYRREKTTLEYLKDQVIHLNEWSEIESQKLAQAQTEFYKGQRERNERIEDLEKSISILEGNSEKTDNIITDIVDKNAIKQIDEVISKLEMANKLVIELKSNFQ
jgi:hypothetical protein